jgi:hypothetical protein
MAAELSASLANLQLANRTILNHLDHEEQQEGGLKDRIAANIRRLFALY